MTYEEKLAITIEAIREAQQFTRKDYYTKLHIGTGNGLSRIHIEHLHEILLQLQDDEKIIEIKEMPTALQPLTVQVSNMLVNKTNYFLIEVLDTFDSWYINYLVQKKSSLEKLDWLNFLKIYDVCFDIDNQIQMTSNTNVVIPAFPYPYLGRYRELFPYDSIGTRKSYQKFRWEGAQYLLRLGIANDVKDKRDDVLGYGNYAINIDIVKFHDFYEKIKNELSKREKVFNEKEKLKKIVEKPLTVENRVVWPKDFKWEGNSFVFGKFGTISLISKDRKHILKTLTDKQGNWATISQLKGDKSASYVRSTIKQIEDRLNNEAKKHIKIISTQEEDSLEKPNQGAYRIKVKT